MDPTFSFKNAYIGFVLDNPGYAFKTGVVIPVDVKLIGVASSETVYSIAPEQQQRSSYGENYVLTWKLDVNVQVLTKMDASMREAIDGKRCAVVIIPSDGIDIEVQWGATGDDIDPELLPQISDMKILAPVRCRITEDEQFGTGEVRPVQITGEHIAATKEDLHKTIEFYADSS